MRLLWSHSNEGVTSPMIRSCLFLLLIGLGVPAIAQDSAPPPEVEQAVNLALANNRSLENAKQPAGFSGSHHAKQSYRFAPHFARTPKELNRSIPERMSDHTADLRLEEPSLSTAPTRSASPPFTDAEVIQGCRGRPATEKAIAPDRMPEIPAEKLTEAQKKAADEFAAGRGTPVFGPFVPLLRSPEVMLRAKAMGDYLRFKSVLPPKLNEFAILLTARQWTQQYEWDVHCPIAIKAGLSPEVAKAVAEGRRPPGMSDDEEIVYEFGVELHRNQGVSDTTYARALAKFGEQGIIDMVGVNGYYTFLAMVLNVARTPLPKGSAPALAAFPQ